MEHGPGLQVTSVPRRLKSFVVILRDKLSNYRVVPALSRIFKIKRTTRDMLLFIVSIVDLYTSIRISPPCLNRLRTIPCVWP